MRTLYEIAQACKADTSDIGSDKKINSITIDSRECNNNSIFIAINNNILDNFRFSSSLPSECIVISEEKIPGHKTLIVKNSLQALFDLAAFFREKELKKTLAITGSVGKTTLKELCVSILKSSEKINIKSTDGNKNNLLGLPLTLLKNGIADIGVLELGISEIGEMELLSSMSRPDIAVITAIGKMHSLGLGGNVAEEKLKICSHLKKDGVLIIPSDCAPLEAAIKKSKISRVIRVGTTELSDVKTENIILEANGTTFDIIFGKVRLRKLFVPIVGQHGATEGAMAASASRLLGASEHNIRDGLANYTPCGDRQNICVKDNITVISDCSNAGPESMKAALEAFSIISQKENHLKSKKILILGDMLELGEISKREHQFIGRALSGLNADIIIAYGSYAEFYLSGAREAGISTNELYLFSTQEDNQLFKLLSKIKKDPCLCLIKGSRGMQMERFSEYLLS